MIGEKKEQLIRELDEAHTRMQQVLQEISLQHEVYPQWTLKQFVAHLAGWDDATLAALRSHQLGTPPPTPAADRGIDFYNSQTVAEREALAFPQIVEEWELAREQLKELLREFPDEKFEEPLIFPWGEQGSVSTIVRIMAHHETEHAEEILKRFSGNN